MEDLIEKFGHDLWQDFCVTNLDYRDIDDEQDALAIKKLICHEINKKINSICFSEDIEGVKEVDVNWLGEEGDFSLNYISVTDAVITIVETEMLKRVKEDYNFLFPQGEEQECLGMFEKIYQKADKDFKSFVNSDLWFEEFFDSAHLFFSYPKAVIKKFKGVSLKRNNLISHG